MKLAIIDYGSGNLRSAAKAFERAMADVHVGGSVQVTDSVDMVRAADRIVLPGVGAFADCRRGLDALPGMVEALDEVVIRGGRPFLGICVGMQLMATEGFEHGHCAGLGWIPGKVTALDVPADLRIPHMGWNSLTLRGDHPLMAGMDHAGDVYFVHSYHDTPDTPDHVIATTDYGGPVTAAIARDNLAGTQFHPEKSQSAGQVLLRNFLRWAP